MNMRIAEQGIDAAYDKAYFSHYAHGGRLRMTWRRDRLAGGHASVIFLEKSRPPVLARCAELPARITSIEVKRDDTRRQEGLYRAKRAFVLPAANNALWSAVVIPDAEELMAARPPGLLDLQHQKSRGNFIGHAPDGYGRSIEDITASVERACLMGYLHRRRGLLLFRAPFLMPALLASQRHAAYYFSAPR